MVVSNFSDCSVPRSEYSWLWEASPNTTGQIWVHVNFDWRWLFTRIQISEYIQNIFNFLPLLHIKHVNIKLVILTNSREASPCFPYSRVGCEDFWDDLYTPVSQDLPNIHKPGHNYNNTTTFKCPNSEALVNAWL